MSATMTKPRPKVALPSPQFKANGCAKEFKAVAVLMKRDVPGGMYILRTLTIKDGVVIKQEDTVEDLQAVQMGKAMTVIEDTFA